MQKNKLKLILIVSCLAIAMGCGESLDKKKTDEGTFNSPTGNVVANNGNIQQTSPFPPRVNGMYESEGKEYLPIQPGVNPGYPSARNWMTRIEFLKEDGSNVDPNSFNPSIGYAKIRLTMFSDANSQIRYVVSGYIWVSFNPYLALKGELRQYDANRTPIFDVQFGDSIVSGPMLGIFGMDGRLFGGTITLVEPAGKHIIQY